MLGNQVLIVLGFGTRTGEALADPPGRVDEAFGASSSEVIERDGEGDIVLDVVEASKAFTKRDTSRTRKK